MCVCVYVCVYIYIYIYTCVCIYIYIYIYIGSDGKESACNARDPGLVPRLGRSTGEGDGTHSSILAWRIPRTEEPSGL